MEHLPTEILVRILLFLDIPAKVKLARCNLTLQQRVYRDCSDAWTFMQFYTYGYGGPHLHLTDLELSTLFTRINAREVVKQLDLEDCGNIRGSGLAPLRNSRVLERVNVENTKFYPNPSVALNILYSSIPYNLSQVLMDKHCESDVFSVQFMRHLHEGRSAKARETMCSSCRNPW